MTVDCPRRDLFEAVQLAGSPATGRATTLPVFQSLLLEAEDGRMRFLGCDGEMWVERTMNATVSNNGAIAVQARLMNDILGQLPEGEVHIEQPTGASLRLSLAASEFRVVGMTPEDFPGIPDVSGQATVKIKKADLLKMVSGVDFAVAKENQGRPVLTGILFQYDGEKLKTVATDTHRLAVMTSEMPNLGQPVSAVVPDRAIQVIKKLPTSESEEITLTFSDDKLLVESDGTRLVAQLLRGEFPSYERVFPSSSTRKWLFDKEVFASALKRAGVLAKESAQRVVLKSDGSQVIMNSRSEGIGEGRDEMEIVKEGDDLEIAFNGRYLLDALSPVATPGVSLEMTENDRPAVIRPSEAGTDYTCVIMPMALI